MAKELAQFSFHESKSLEASEAKIESALVAVYSQGMSDADRDQKVEEVFMTDAKRKSLRETAEYFVRNNRSTVYTFYPHTVIHLLDEIDRLEALSELSRQLQR